MSTALSGSRATYHHRSREAEFTLDRLAGAIRTARMRAADGPLDYIWVDIFESEHLLQYCRGISAALERLTRSLEEYARR
jgi:hypothetical protein